MADQGLSVRRRGVRKTAVKTIDSNKTNDDLESGVLCPYQLIFLLQSTFNNTNYIDVYKDAVDGMHNVEDQACNVVVIDYNRLVESIDNSCVEQDEQYRVLHDRAKRYFHNNSRVSTKLMVLLVRQLIIINLESMRQKWNFETEPYTFQPALVNIILTNFIDLGFMTEFIATKIKVDAIVELACGEIAQTREKFVSSAFRAKQSMADKVIQSFWRNFHDGLNTAEGASVFKNVVVYQYKSKYNADYEPPNVDKMLVAARRYVTREMHKVLLFVYNVRVEYEKYTRNDNPVYALPIEDVDSTVQKYYESYTKHLKEYPEDAIGLPTILDAIVKSAIADPIQTPTERWVDGFFSALRDDSDDGCMVYPVCVQYGNEYGLIAKKYDLRHTDYFDSAVNVLNIRWRKSLWGSRLLPSSDVEAEHHRVIAHIKKKCEHRTSSDDVDVQLCTLALNRLRCNLDVYRGEPIGLSGLGQTNIYFRPELIEPAGCATMVQMLQKESENYRRMSHAYFEPEDVVVVGFYDCQKVLQTRKSSFRFTLPQRPDCAKDYFDLHYGKRMPNCFYAMGTTAVAATSDLSLTYTEETEEIRFKDDDYLTISKRKWRFEPSTVSLMYKSDFYEIVKQVKSDDDDRHRRADEDDDNDDQAKDSEDWLRIYNIDAGLDYYVDKSPKNDIRCICRKSWLGSKGTCTVEMISWSDQGYGMLQQSNRRQGDVDSAKVSAKVNAAEVEVCRLYGNGRVVVEYADRTKVTYWSSGKINRPSRTNKTTPMESPKSNSGRPRTSTISSDNSDNSAPAKIDYSKSVRVKKSQARKNTKSVIGMNKSPSRMKRKKSNVSPSNISNSNKNNDLLQDPRIRRYADYEERFSEDGTTRTVEFADGTCIVGATNVRRSSTIVPPYEYSHPAYHTVTEERDGTFNVAGLCTMSRGLAGGPVGLRLTDRSVRIDATTDAVYVYRSYGDGEEQLTATFGWNDSEFLFEKRVNAARVVTVPRNRRLGDDLILGMTGTTTVTAEEAASKSECFVVRRGMSGFRMLEGRRYKRFADDVRGRQHTVVRESQRVKTVTVFAAYDVDVKKPWVTELPTVANGKHYAWLKPFSSKAAVLDDERVPTTMQLMSRSFRKVDVDYGPVIKALTLLRNIGSTDVATVDVLPGKLRVRVFVPDVDALRKMYAHENPRNRKSSTSSHVSALAHNEQLSAKLAHLRQELCNVLEAQSLMRRGQFIPFFHADDFGPLRSHLKANGLQYFEE